MKTATVASADSYSAFSWVRRLVVDEALSHWRRYALALAVMGIAASATALGAYLIGTLTNEAYVSRNFHGIVVIGVLAMAVFTTKGLSTYGAAVLLNYIGNGIVAKNQRRMFDKLLHENIGYFADRHSSEFIARLATGAAAVSQVINLVITAVGRDLMSLIGLSLVMVIQDPVMSIAGIVISRPALYISRKMIRRL